ncbi:hypothetical protein DCAR_0206541 [Daucus carota subsp. sativus]|uniref:CW-type domain-containing protein n=1 Tax=Daucus carota subsp. sativus TaxID=79200 RepID=A0AAF0WFG9_DAUCS|nr:hypothetical protein DCAR_0206541 [Daucus carota subsp. sativus]
MEVMELEEGEACLNKKDLDSTFDPDVAFSYIDEKLENVLGHFQKDFEGGVSAENLGSKFGGYGSFLPTYQRSPVWSQPKVQNENASKSPNSLPLEGARGHSVSSSASLSARHGSTALGVATLPVSRASPVDNCVTQAATMPLTSAKNKSNSHSDQKNYKVRIRRLSDNWSTKKKSEIYSGLGLDVSPTSSFEDSPTDGELAREPQNLPEFSPTSILEIMKSFPLHDSLRLSPLCGDLICLNDKEMRFQRSGAVTIAHMGDQEGSDSGRCDRNFVREKKTKSSEQKAFTAESKTTNVHSTQNGVDVLMKRERERDVENSFCDEIVSNTFRLPLLSNSNCSVADSAKDTARNADVSTRVVNKREMEENFHDLAKDEPQGPTSVQGNAFIGKANAKAVSRTNKTNSYDNKSGYLAKGGNIKGERIDIPLRVDPHMSKEMQGFIPELKSVPSVDDDMKVSSGLKDTYKEFFGEELEDDNCSAGEEGYGEFKSVTEDQSSSKKFDQLSRSEAHTRVSSSLFHPTGNKPIPDVAAPQVPFVNEDWVCCDKCQKWRLLPAGKNPESLPKIWLCSMLNWLDGMNRCSISEEETTKAVLALQQTFPSAPVHGGQNSQNRYSGVVSSGVADAWHVDQCIQDVGGRKNHGIKDVYNAFSHNGSSPYSDSKKKIFQAPVETQSLNGENHSPSFNKDEVSGQSSGLVGQKCRHRKEKIPLANTVEGSDFKSLKMRSSGEKNEETFKAPKKLKAGGVQIDEDWKSDNGAAALKVGCSSNSFPINKSQELQHKHDGYPKDSKSLGNSEDWTQFSSDASLLHTENFTDRDVKKRKISEYQGSQLYATSRSNEGHHLEHHKDYMEETNESNHRKEKKARVPRSEGKESFMSKGSGRIDNKEICLKDQQAGADPEDGHFRRSLDVPIKKDTGSSQPAIAATSSSSKISGSCKIKSNLQEVKDSPVESVSSSPSRNSKQDKFMSTGRDLRGKGGSEALILATSSPRKCSNGDDGSRIDQSSMVQKNVTITNIKHGSLESSMHEFQDRNQSHISRRKDLPEARKSLVSEECPNDESGRRYQYHSNGSDRKTGKESSPRSKDKFRGTKSESEKGYLREASSNGYAGHGSHIENSKARSKVQEKSALNSDKVEKNLFGTNELAANPSFESGKREAQSDKASFDNTAIRQNISNHHSEPNQPMDSGSERFSKRFPTDKKDRVDVLGKTKSNPLPPSGRGQNEMERRPQPVNENQKDNGIKLSTVSTGGSDEALKCSKQINRSENHSGNINQPSNSRNPTNGHKDRDIDVASSIRRDSTTQAANNAVKEAKDLKHLADRLKNSGSILESMGLYFQAALKFLYGASLLESSNNENSKHGEAIQSIQMYSSTAKLFEFCAHEYEKLNDMSSAALAYKCVEVAYFRVIYFSHSNASKDRHELLTALQIVPPGESPSSSASDVDNMNNIATMDKVSLTKGVNSPQVAGNHVIPARSRPNFTRLLNFVQEANFAMEASRKSRSAFLTASREETKYRDGLPSVKKALDFSFKDMDGFLRLVRLAMEAISR